MSYHLEAILVVPSEAFMSRKLFHLLGTLKDLPNTDLPAIPERVSDIDFFEYIDKYLTTVNGLEIIIDGSISKLYEHPIEVPEGLEYLLVSINESRMVGMVDNHDRFKELLQLVFEGMGAMYAVTLHELDLAVERMAWEEFRALPGGVHMFSRRLVDAVGRERLLAAAPEGGDLAGGGVWLRFQEEYFHGMPLEYQEQVKMLLDEIWETVNLP